MESEFIIRINDILDRPIFRNCKVVAGRNGLWRRIRWVHILEVSQVDMLIHGEEMILSTGVGLAGETSKEEYLEKLIHNGASCLCIEQGKYFEHVTPEMIKIADENNFPLIIFTEKVRFVDITQDLHSLIINRHHQMLEQLEIISRELYTSTLTSQANTNILKILHSSTKADVYFLPLHGKAQCVPVNVRDDNKKQTVRQLGAKISEQTGQPLIQWKEGERYFLMQEVGAMGQIWGYLSLCFEEKLPGEFDLLVLDRAALSLAQDLLRKRYVEERKLHSEHIWVDDLINGRIRNEEQIQSYLGKKASDLSNVEYKVCLIEYFENNEGEPEMFEEDPEALRFHISLLVRSSFESHGFLPYLTAKGNQLIVIATNRVPGSSPNERLNKVIDSLLALKEERKKLGRPIDMRIGFGRTYKKWIEATNSYLEAKYVLKVQSLAWKKTNYYYEDIGIFRLMLNLENEAALEDFVADYLGPLIEYERVKGGDLLHTLKVYLDNDGSKQATSQELFIVRQTIYHRLEKIKELLGEDFMLPEKRLSIEVALRAYLLLHRETQS
ncbi:PucR family transcriptional regulator [Ferviditalea candida]|uniref:PucR family transcriptional regulator ligand-binding domain-containing protein n=1 Tax=Ferviditalea candida TaxID=3108399 RepID=A0ABU5ZLH9_9BACL|nr:PucR family transcriptional regulator ligand-binding domain-containing protein [Paenibacillaceae bacterium T2]